MKPLFEISNEYTALIQELENADELTDEHVKLLNQLDGDLNSKALNVGAYIKNIQLESESIDHVIKDLGARRDKLEKKIERLKDYLKINLEKCSIKEIKSPLFDIKVRNNPPHVVVIDEALIPADYIKETVMRRIDKALISQELKKDIFIPGAMLEQNTSLQIS